MQFIQILSCIPLLAAASVEMAPFEELYKYDRKTGKVVAGSIPLHTTIYQTLFVCLQTTFHARMTYTEGSMKILWSLRQGFHN